VNNCSVAPSRLEPTTYCKSIALPIMPPRQNHSDTIEKSIRNGQILPFTPRFSLFDKSVLHSTWVFVQINTLLHSELTEVWCLGSTGVQLDRGVVGRPGERNVTRATPSSRRAAALERSGSRTASTYLRPSHDAELTTDHTVRHVMASFLDCLPYHAGFP